jgi:hypothetical protein
VCTNKYLVDATVFIGRQLTALMRVACRRLVYVRAAGPLTVTVLSIAISNIFHLYNAPYNIKTVGTVPAVSHA